MNSFRQNKLLKRMKWRGLLFMSPDSSRLLLIFAVKRPIDKEFNPAQVAAKRYTKRKGEFLFRE